jgi:hypothetical protein
MREGRAEGRANEQAHSLSLSRTLVTPTTSTPLVRDNTSRVFPLCSISRQPIWAGARNDKFTRRSRDPPGLKRRHFWASLPLWCLVLSARSCTAVPLVRCSSSHQIIGCKDEILGNLITLCHMHILIICCVQSSHENQHDIQFMRFVDYFGGND